MSTIRFALPFLLTIVLLFVAIFAELPRTITGAIILAVFIIPLIGLYLWNHSYTQHIESRLREIDDAHREGRLDDLF